MVNPFSAVPSAPGSRSRAASRTCWIPWAEFLRRVFSEDVSSWPRCSGRMKVIAAVTNPQGARRILEHLGLPPRAPPVAPARLPSDDWEG